MTGLPGQRSLPAPTRVGPAPSPSNPRHFVTESRRSDHGRARYASLLCAPLRSRSSVERISLDTSEPPEAQDQEAATREPFAGVRRTRLLYQPLDPKAALPLHPSMRSDEALQVLGRYQLGKLLGAQSGVVHDLHPEHLHDFRVALRRTRTLWGQLRDTLLEKPYQHFRAEFKWLGASTSVTRDLDVLLEELPRYRGWVSKELDGAVEVLQGQFRALRNSAHQSVVETLESERYRLLIREWQSFLASPIAYTPLTAAAGAATRKTAKRLIQRQTQRVFKLTRAVTRKSSETELHRLRIEGKKLRYLFEFFGSLFPRTPIQELITRLKEFQDRLGLIHDEAIHRDLLLRLARDPMGARTPAALVASGEITRSLRLRMEEDVRKFAADSKRFVRKKNRRRFARLR